MTWSGRRSPTILSRNSVLSYTFTYIMRPKGEIRGRASRDVGEEGGYEAFQSMLTGEYTEESTGARTIRQTGGKDRHSKVFTSRGPRDRRVRLSVATAIRFYDLQDRLGFDQPSKAVEWLLLHCQTSIKALPQLGTNFRRPHAGIITALHAPQPAHLSDHPPPHDLIQAMDLKSSCENSTHYNALHNHRFGQDTHHDHGAQLASLQQYSQRIQAAYGKYSLDTHSLYDAHAQQDSIEEDPPQSSNPSSSGGSSDHPTSLSKVSQNQSFEAAISTHESILHQQPNLTSTPFDLCSLSKRRRMQLSPACFSEVDHHAQADNYASFTSESNAGGNCTTPENHQCCSLAMSERLLNANNMTAPHYDHGSVISSNTGSMYGTVPPPASYSLIGNSMHNMGTNAPLSIRQSDFLMDNSLQGTQMGVAMQQMVQVAGTSAEPNKYIDVGAQLQQLRAETNDLANDTMMAFQGVVQGDSMSGMGANMEDTMQMYGKMGLCGIVSPCESNNNNNNHIANYDGKARISENMQANHDQYRPTLIDWTLKHTLL